MIIKRVLQKLRLIKPEDYNSIEAYRQRGVKIGNNVDIINCLIDGCHSHLISIGNNVTLTGVHILAHDGSTKKFLGYSKVGIVEIGDNVFIGVGCIILPNTHIGNNVIIGAGTVVARDVPSNSVIVGNPWRVICSFEEYIERNRKAMKTQPVSDKIFFEKTDDDWVKLIEDLKANGGYGFEL